MDTNMAISLLIIIILCHAKNNGNDSLVSSLLKLKDLCTCQNKIEETSRFCCKLLKNTSSFLVHICSEPSLNEGISSQGLMKGAFLETCQIIKVDRTHPIVNLSNVFENQESFFKISPLLASYLSQERGPVYIQFIATKSKLLWSVTAPIDHLVSLTISRMGETYKALPHPIDVYFKYKAKSKLNLTREFITLPSSRETEELISVYKIDRLQLQGSVKVLFKFHNVSSGDNFKVLLLQNVQPDFDVMISFSKDITRDSTAYEVHFENQTESDIYYLGILPQCNLTERGRRALSFEVRYLQCLSTQGTEWSSDGCYVGEETTEELLHCQCWHLSLFGGNVAIPPHPLNLVSDIQLLMDVRDNPQAFLLVSCLILVYLMVLVWTRHSDRKDELQRFVVVLEDNFPGEKWAYLITVYTGFWIGAGTDSNVGLRLYGTEGMSRVHILKSRKRKVLKGNCDDWFLIFTPKSLGDIVKIYLFHDHTGRSDDWYCTKILIYDLKVEKNFTFIIEKWLSLKEDDENVELYIFPIATLKYLRRGRVALDNIIFGLRETHLLLSIFTRHPRSSVTRSQRLSICLCIIMVNLLTSIMFYKVDGSSENPDYSSSRRQIIISMESTLFAAPFAFIVIFCFKKSRIIMPPNPSVNVPMTLTAKMAVPLESGLHVNQSQNQLSAWDSVSSLTGSSNTSTEEEDEDSNNSCWESFYHRIQILLFQVILIKPMMPVQIAEEDKESTHVRKKWMYAAWFLCETAIFAGGFFILIYSLKMDSKTSDEWIQQSFQYSLANIFFMSPVKIIIFALILAVLYGQLQYIPSYECNTEVALNMESVGNKKFLARILKVRKSSFYCPLNHRKTLIIRMHTKNWRRWRIVINFVVVILLYIVLTVEVVFLWKGLYVTTGNHMMQMFNEKLGKSKITSFAHYTEYLLTVALPASNKETWYNGATVTPPFLWKQNTGYTSDYSTRLIGFPRLRQQRIIKDSCKVNSMMKNRFSECYAPLSWSFMDKKVYSAHWTEPQRPMQSDSPWVFSDSDGPLLVCGLKTKICYPPGGYTALLDYNHTNSKTTLLSLYESGWFDRYTRVIFFELIFYNANSNLMSYVTPILEKLANGEFLFHVKATVLHPRPSHYIIRVFIILSFTFYYLCRIVLLFNRRGLAYLISWTGLLDIFLNVLLYTTTISLMFYNEARKSYLDKWHRNEDEDLRMTTDIFVHRDVLRYETAILMIIIPAQVLHNFRFGKRHLIIFNTLTNYSAFAFGLGFIVFIFYMTFLQIGIIHRIDNECFTLNRIFGWLSYHNFAESYTYSRYKTFSTIFCYVVNIIAFFTVITAVYCYKENKERLKYCKDFNILIFLCEKLKYAKIIIYQLRNKLTKGAETRSRAGADDWFTTDEEISPSNKTCSQVRKMCTDLDFKLDVVLKKLTEINRAT